MNRYVAGGVTAHRTALRALVILVVFLVSLPLALPADGPDDDSGSRVEKQLATLSPDNRKAGDPLNVNVSSIDVTGFPVVRLFVDVWDDQGNGVAGLDEGAFRVEERAEDETAPVLEAVNVTQVEQFYDNVSIAIIFDRSGSMQPQMAEAKQSVRDFVSNFLPEDRAALISFAGGVRTDVPFTFTDDEGKRRIYRALDSLYAYGSTALVDATWAGVDATAQEPGSRAVIVFTDGQDNSSHRSLGNLIQHANDLGISIYTIGLGPAVDEGMLRAMAERTGGEYRYAPRADDLAAIYEEIREHIAQQYLVVYRSHRPVEDGTLRFVDVTVDHDGHRATDRTEYRAQLPPRIFLTEETEALSWRQQDAGTPLRIEANILSGASIQWTKLYYRRVGSSTGFAEQEMQPAGGTTWAGEIPGDAVVEPGVEYYLVTSDGTYTATAPSTNPQQSAYQVPVGNQALIIEHVPVRVAPYGQDIPIGCTVSTSGAQLESVFLEYRHATSILYRAVEMNCAASDASEWNCTAEIPGGVHTAPGTDYYIVARVESGRRASRGTAEKPLRINYQPSTIQQSINIDEARHWLTVTAIAYDPVNGGYVTEGDATFAIYSADGTRLRHGHLWYRPELHAWQSFETPWSEEGVFVSRVEINGAVSNYRFVSGPRHATIQGFVKDVHGQVVPGAIVQLEKGSLTADGVRWDAVASVESDAGGSFFFGDLDAGTYRLTARAGDDRAVGAPFYAVGDVRRNAYLAPIGMVYDELDRIADSLLALQRKHAQLMSDESARIDDLVGGSGLWENAVDTTEFVLFIADIYHAGRLLIDANEWKGTAQALDEMARADIFDLSSSEAAKKALESYKVAAKAAGHRIAEVGASTLIGIAEKWGVHLGVKYLGMAQELGRSYSAQLYQKAGALDLLLGSTADPALADETYELWDSNLPVLWDATDWFVPADDDFGGRPLGGHAPWWPKEQRPHYRSVEEILERPIARWAREFLVDSGDDRGLHHWKSLIAEVPTHPERLDPEILRGILERQANLVRDAGETLGTQLVAPDLEPIPINLRAEATVYFDAKRRVRYAMLAKTAIVAAEVGLAVSGVVTGGATTIIVTGAFVAFNAMADTFETTARSHVAVAYEDLAQAWNMTQVALPHVLDRAGWYALAELRDPTYAAHGARTAFDGEIVDVEFDGMTINGVPCYVGLPFGPEHEMRFRIRSTGTEDSEFGAVVYNRRNWIWNAYFSEIDDEPGFSGYETMGFWTFPNGMDPNAPDRRTLGYLLAPGETTSTLVVPFKATATPLDILRPRYLLIEALAGPLVVDVEKRPYITLMSYPPPKEEPSSSTKISAAMGGRQLTVGDIEKLAPRFVDLDAKGPGKLTLGKGVYETTVTVPDDVWSVAFQLTAPTGHVELHVYEGDAHVGWNPEKGIDDVEFPAEKTGGRTSQEVRILNAAGRTFRVVVRVDESAPDVDHPFDLEMVSTPRRKKGILSVVPREEFTVAEEGPFSLTVMVAEAGGQQPLHDVDVILGSLVNDNGDHLVLDPAGPAASQRIAIVAGGSSEAVTWKFQQAPATGTYRGKVTFKGTPGTLVEDLVVHVGRNQPPVADAGPDQEAECQGPFGAAFTFDGSGSYDPDGDPLSYAWSSASCSIDDSTAETTTGTCPLGDNTVTLVVNDGQVDSAPDEAGARVVDTTAPDGGITFPENGACLQGPVEVVDDFSDICDPDLARIYDPPGGPVYEEERQWTVTVVARDRSGNEASDEVMFILDNTPPVVVPLEPMSPFQESPRTDFFGRYFHATDDDAAPGGVVHERLLVDGCVVFDGDEYGDGDGLLEDDQVDVPLGLVCALWRKCHVRELVNPVFRIEAEDCAGNVGYVEVPRQGHWILDVRPCQ